MRGPMRGACRPRLLAAAASCGAALPAQGPQAGPEPWSFGLSAYGYATPERDYVQPTVVADRGALHLEARWNYEDVDTGSVWVGGNLSFGDEDRVRLELTPMLGAVFGETSGVAPGYRGSLRWWRLELYGEGEYLIDSGDSSDSFFYSWSELSIAPAERLRAGIAVQRTRAYEAERDVQRGLLVGFGAGPFDVTAYVFDPDEDEPTFVLGMGLSF